MQPRRHRSPEQRSLEIWCEKDTPTAAYPRNWETICSLNIKPGLSKLSKVYFSKPRFGGIFEDENCSSIGRVPKRPLVKSPFLALCGVLEQVTLSSLLFAVPLRMAIIIG